MLIIFVEPPQIRPYFIREMLLSPCPPAHSISISMPTEKTWKKWLERFKAEKGQRTEIRGQGAEVSGRAETGEGKTMRR